MCACVDVFFLLCKLNTSWKSETCQKNLFSAQLYNMCCSLCESREANKKYFECIYRNHFMRGLVCDIYLLKIQALVHPFLFSLQRYNFKKKFNVDFNVTKLNRIHSLGVWGECMDRRLLRLELPGRVSSSSATVKNVENTDTIKNLKSFSKFKM